MEKRIKTEEEYQQVANQIETLIDAAPGTQRAKKLKRLIQAIIAYEKIQLVRSRNRVSATSLRKARYR